MWRTNRTADLTAGLLLIGVGVAVLLASATLRASLVERLDPRTIPFGIAALLILCGAVLAINSFRRPPEPIDWPDHDGATRVLVILGLTAAYIATMGIVGAPLGTFLVVCAMTGFIGDAWKLGIVVGLATAVIVTVVFIEFLDVGLPLGVLEGLLDLTDLIAGFAAALSPENLVFALIGAVLGTLVGVLPGIGPTAGVAILIPLTATLSPTAAIIMMAAIYYGAMYGGSTTAIVANIPGEATSVITALDGYELAKQGRAGPALGISAISSFVAGTVGLIGLTLFAPVLADLALKFGPPEYFALMFLALSLVIVLSGRALLKGVASAAIGLLTASIGVDAYSGVPRLTFGFPELQAGFSFVAVIIGLFAISEVLLNVERRVAYIYEVNVKDWLPTRADIKASTPAMIRSSFSGFGLGLLPGVTPVVATFLSYDLERRLSRNKANFGKGAIEGVAAAEGANNSAVSGGFVPLLALGIPSGATMAILLGALMIYGVQPGPRLFVEHPDVAWALIASMYIGNVMLLVLNLPLVGIWARIALIPFPVLAPIIVICSVIGAYSVRDLPLDVWVMFAYGIVGYLMRKTGFPLAPLVLAAVLSPMLEAALRQSTALSHGSFLIFFERPISLVLMLVAIVLIVRGLWAYARGAGDSILIADDSD